MSMDEAILLATASLISHLHQVWFESFSLDCDVTLSKLVVLTHLTHTPTIILAINDLQELRRLKSIAGNLEVLCGKKSMVSLWGLQFTLHEKAFYSKKHGRIDTDWSRPHRARYDLEISMKIVLNCCKRMGRVHLLIDIFFKMFTGKDSYQHHFEIL